MGLISTALLSASSTLSDSWKEYFYCDAIPSDVFVVKGIKRNSGGFSSVAIREATTSLQMAR